MVINCLFGVHSKDERAHGHMSHILHNVQNDYSKVESVYCKKKKKEKKLTKYLPTFIIYGEQISYIGKGEPNKLQMLVPSKCIEPNVRLSKCIEPNILATSALKIVNNKKAKLGNTTHISCGKNNH